MQELYILNRCRAAALFVALSAMPLVVDGQVVQPGFEIQPVISGFTAPVDIEFASDGRMFVAEQRGMVWVVQNGQTLPQPFIDLRDEVNAQWDHGLLGIALHPDFLFNRQVYLLYTVDPMPGEPDEPPEEGSAGRLTRYTGTAASGGNVADPGSRLVLLGDPPGEGFPVCDRSHAVGDVMFANDGSLFVSSGDGAHFEFADAGGADPECFVPWLFGIDEDIGAFRSQYLGSLAGKVLRVDPETGLGLSDNPFWNGLGDDNPSKVWVSGLRNPLRFDIRPGSTGPGTLYICDVGWFTFEEVSVAGGGENFGWPCEEGTAPAPEYPGLTPAHSGCDSIETPANPGPLTPPVVSWHHTNAGMSTPPGFGGRAATACAFYTGVSYPNAYQGAMFFADYAFEWINVLHVDDSDDLVSVQEFAAVTGNIVDLTPHPLNGDLYCVAIHQNEIRRIRYTAGMAGDLNGDGSVGAADLALLLGSWGPCDACPADLDGNFIVNAADLAILLGSWG